jgi:hypothetical protein
LAKVASGWIGGASTGSGDPKYSSITSAHPDTNTIPENRQDFRIARLILPLRPV